MLKVRFRLTGVPPDQSIKLIDIDESEKIDEIKKSIQKEYKLNPILTIQLIYKGKVVDGSLTFKKLNLNPKVDVITIMATQAGGIF